MATAPLLFQVHALAALGLFAIWPFTRLVHTWAVPIGLFCEPSPTRAGRTGTPVG